MKKFFYAFIAVVLFLSSCTPSPDRVIMYKTNDNKPIAFGEDKFGNAKLVSNEYSEEEKCFVAVFDKAINAIGNSAFSYCSSLTSITIPNSVKEIGYQAFSKCSSLQHLRIEDGINDLYISYDYYNERELGRGMFYDCPLKTLHLGRNLRFSIGKSVGYSPFAKTGLISVTIGNCVYSIQYDCFRDCSNLANVTMPNNLEKIRPSAFKGCCNLSIVEIPDSVISIGFSAFSGCSNLASIIIPKGVKTIEKETFNGCVNLTSIKLHDKITVIEEGAFFDCKNLANITIPNSVKYIGCFALHNTAWYENKPDGIILAGKTLYEYNGNIPENFTIPDSITSIAGFAFLMCNNLVNITIPNSVTSIGKFAFYGCENLRNITIPNSVTSIGDLAFADCVNLSEIMMSNSVTSVGRNIFHGTKWYKNQPDGIVLIDKTLYEYKGNISENIIIPNGVTNIAAAAFDDCKNLISITIPKSVINISDLAFKGCTALKHLCIEDGDNPLSLGYDEFNKEDRGKSLFYDCPLESIYLGRNIVCKKDYNYGFSPFCEKERLRTVTIGNSVNRIDYAAFADCRNLISLTIQNGVKEIGNQAFKNCPALTSVEIPNSVTSIERGAFSWCVSLTNIRIPKSAKVDETAFEGCDNLKINY